MPMTITVTPEIEELLNKEAHRLGKTPEQVALERLGQPSGGPALQPLHTMPTPEELDAMSHAERVYALMGSLAHLGPSRLMRDKEAEKRREERRWKPGLGSAGA